MIRVERYRWLLTEATTETGGTGLTGLILDYGLEVIIYILRKEAKAEIPCLAQYHSADEAPLGLPDDLLKSVLSLPKSPTSGSSQA